MPRGAGSTIAAVVLRVLKSLIPLGLLLGLVSGPAGAQAPAAFDSRVSASFAEFEGTYDYHDGGTLVMVAERDRLIAIIGEATYPLKPAGPDRFTNPGGDPIPFQRDSNRRIVSFREGNFTFRRRSTNVDPAIRLLLEPRRRGSDGRPLTYTYQPPEQLPDGIESAPAGSGSLSTDAAEWLVNGVIEGKYPEVRSILVHHKGALRLEEYFYGYDRARPHQMRSLTKSVISLLAGAAVDRKLLRADEPVLERLGYPAPANPDPRKSRITLTHLLSHQSGLACNDYDQASPGNEVKLYETEDWVKAFIDLPMVTDPGTVGFYCSGGIIASGRMIERAAKQPLAEFARTALLEPLGIRSTDWKWNFTLNRSQRGDFGQIYLRPRDMLKLGILIQQRGLWQGRRVVSQAWIDAAVGKQSRVDDSDYGLGIWHRWYNVATPAGQRRVDTIMLSGNGGQKVYVVPSLDLIVVFTGASFNVNSPVNDMMAKVLLPAVTGAAGSGR
jgi:CubicO group peptidase (beta-lactamase class C family)